LRGASSKVGELSDSYAKASAALVGMTENAEAGSSTGEHLQRMSSNLSNLNQMYEVQLEELRKTSGLYSGIGELLTNLNDSVEDTRKYKENIAELSKSLASLNTVYGNMLSAMTINR
jgi:gliding motility-associated protein GldL